MRSKRNAANGSSDSSRGVGGGGHLGGEVVVVGGAGEGGGVVAEELAAPPVAGLAFFGEGGEPVLIEDGADAFRALWWMSVFPGIAILATVMAVNAIGDGVRAAADPRQHRPA